MSPVVEFIVNAVLVVLLLLVLASAIRRAHQIGKEDEYRVPPSYYARAGELVTCSGGHVICDVAEDIHLYDVIRASHFTNWRDIDAPQAEDPLIRNCPVCNEPFMKIAGQRYVRLHVNGGWR